MGARGKYCLETRMFENPFTAVMALIILAFVGTLAVFFRISRELTALRRALGDVRESLQYYIVDAAQQNRDLESLVRELRSLSAKQDAASKEHEENLTDLLERGIPNLMADVKLDRDGQDDGHAFGGRVEEEDFLRRFEAGPRKNSSL